MGDTITTSEDAMAAREIDVTVTRRFVSANRDEFNATAPDSVAARKYCRKFYDDREIFFTSTR